MDDFLLLQHMVQDLPQGLDVHNMDACATVVSAKQSWATYSCNLLILSGPIYSLFSIYHLHHKMGFYLVHMTLQQVPIQNGQSLMYVIGVPWLSILSTSEHSSMPHVVFQRAYNLHSRCHDHIFQNSRGLVCNSPTRSCKKTPYNIFSHNQPLHYHSICWIVWYKYQDFLQFESGAESVTALGSFCISQYIVQPYCCFNQACVSFFIAGGAKFNTFYMH